MSSLNQTFKAVKAASRELNLTDENTINRILLSVADEAEKCAEYILRENARDLALMDKNNPKYDRLMLTPERISGISEDMRKVAALPSPLGHILSEDYATQRYENLQNIGSVRRDRYYL